MLRLLHSAFAYQEQRIDPPSSLHRLDGPSIEQKARAESLVLAWDGADLAGCLFARPQGDALYVGKVAVWPHRQGQGIGRRLMRAAQQVAHEQGLGALELETRIELTENHRAFASMGAEIGAHAHDGFDRPTSLRMRKPLQPLTP